MEDRIDSYKAEHPEVGQRKFFSYQPHKDPASPPVRDVIRRALDLGIRTFETSPYYDPKFCWEKPSYIQISPTNTLARIIF